MLHTSTFSFLRLPWMGDCALIDQMTEKAVLPPYCLPSLSKPGDEKDRDRQKAETEIVFNSRQHISLNNEGRTSKDQMVCLVAASGGTSWSKESRRPCSQPRMLCVVGEIALPQDKDLFPQTCPQRAGRWSTCMADGKRSKSESSTSQGATRCCHP